MRGTVGRAGVATVAELVLVLVLLAVLFLGLTRFTMAQHRLALAQRDIRRGAEARRTAAVVLTREFRYLVPSDMGLFTPESIHTRVFRGGGRVCSSSGATLDLAYRGVRLPNPAKDSLLLLTAAGETVTAVEALAEAAGCGGAEPGAGPVHGAGGAEGAAGAGTSGLRVTMDRDPGPVLWGAVFESGSYHAVAGALRYRRGGEGRQPLTETFHHRIALARSPDMRHYGIEMAVDEDSLPHAARGYTIRFSLLNEQVAP